MDISACPEDFKPKAFCKPCFIVYATTMASKVSDYKPALPYLCDNFIVNFPAMLFIVNTKRPIALILDCFGYRLYIHYRHIFIEPHSNKSLLTLGTNPP